jgi:hypothetical protein
MNSVLYKAEGISNYNALQLQVRKRLSFGLTLTGSYTWSHALDEQSGLGIFFTGNNPVTPRSSYASADFDQTHVFLVNYAYTIPKFNVGKGLGYLVNGWTISGQTVAQSGQPYSVYDYSGSVGSLYYGTDIYIANPIVSLNPGVTVQQAQLQGTTGVNAGKPVLNVADFYPQFVAPGTYGVPACDTSGCDSYESIFSATGRNIFRGPFQVRFDMGLQKEFLLHDKYRLRFNAAAFNLFNHPDFDTPKNDVTYFADFSAPPLAVPEGSLGYIQHTIGSSRFLQLALHPSRYTTCAMRLTMRAWITLALLGSWNCGTAFSQTLAFTSRTYVQSPVVITSAEGSKEFGFKSVAIRNDGPNPIGAVHFEIMLRTGAGDEIADERRVSVIIEPRDTKRVLVDLGHIEGLKQQTKSRKQKSALAILTIESVEFQDGSEWKQTERDGGTPIDPAPPAKERPRK